MIIKDFKKQLPLKIDKEPETISEGRLIQILEEKREKKEVIDLGIPVVTMLDLSGSCNIKDVVWEEACRECGHYCCLKKLKNEDISAIRFKEKELQLVGKYLKKSFNNLKKLSIKTRKDSDGSVYMIPKPCPFYDKEKKECSVYPARPLVCRFYPLEEPVYYKNSVSGLKEDVPIACVSSECPVAFKVATDLIKYKYKQAKDAIEKTKPKSGIWVPNGNQKFIKK